MTDPHANATGSADGGRLFTFRSGGWVVLVTSLVMLALVMWAVAPAVMRSFARPPGDGRTLESYRFALEPSLVPRELIKPIMLHRDMVPVMTAPAHMPGAQVAALNEEERGKFLVSTDRVIGVVIDGEARAYPVTLLYVHEIVHDTLAGVPIAVTYYWPTDSPRVVRRTIDGVAANFAVSGLLHNSNSLYYIRTGADPGGEMHVPESLYSQLEARAITGPDAAAGRALKVVPCQLTTWSHWLLAYPATTVVTKDPALAKRYKQSEPKQYFIEDTLIAPVAPMPPPGGPGPKEKMIALRGAGVNQVYPLAVIASLMGETGAWTLRSGDLTVTFHLYDETTRTVLVTPNAAALEQGLDVIHGFWFALHALDPDLVLIGPPGAHEP